MPESEGDLDWRDSDDAPELTADFFRRAEVRRGETVVQPAEGTLTRRGRPRSPATKQQVTLRLDRDVLDRLRSTGPGWQSRINEILRRAAGI
ncbi:MAG TPA: BrnA antitoxin family protein [Caulobacteraceae bacterium]|jgi:uncharacterized protein (DUF4415 family)